MAASVGKVAAVLLAATAPLPLCPAAPLQAQTSLTIYNDGRVLVRRSVSANVPKGSSTQRLALGALDPATLFSLDSSVTLERVAYDGAVDEASVLRRSVGKRLVFRHLRPARHRQRAGARRGSAAAPVARRPDQLQPARAGACIPATSSWRSRPLSLGPERAGAAADAAGIFHERRQLAGELSGGVGTGGRPGDWDGGAAVRVAPG